MIWPIEKACALCSAASRVVSRLAASLLSMTIFAGALPAFAQEWPSLRSPSSDLACAKSLGLAEAAFRSPSPIVYDTRAAPAELKLTLVIRPNDRDISGGHSLDIDPASVVEIPAPDGRRRSLYWQRQSQHGMRFVLSEREFSWQGDWFELFAVPRDVTPTELQAQIDINDHSKSKIQPLLENDWRPPLLIKDQPTGEIWAIQVGPPYGFLNDWNVYAIGDDGVKKRCAIQFRPDIAPPERIGKAWDLLPTDVRELAKLIDGTLGTGENEGTANPTARVRIRADNQWGNVAMRPWVFANIDTATLRDTTGKFLESWGRTSKSFARHHLKIKKQYPLAESALTDHYQRTFGMSRSDAISAAKTAIDMAVAANFSWWVDRPLLP